MANQGTIIAITMIVALLVGGALLQDKYDFFAVTGAETMTRDIPTEVDAGSSVQVTYTASDVSGKWGASIIDTLACPGMSDQEKQFVMISDGGTTKTLSYNMPTEEGVQCTLAGNYKFGDKDTKTFSTKIVKTKVTTIPHDTKQCYNGDVYWFDSNGDVNDLFESCSDGCENAECKTCNTEFDTDCDGLISTDELFVVINKWLSEEVSRSDLGIAIQAWAV